MGVEAAHLEGNCTIAPQARDASSLHLLLLSHNMGLQYGGDRPCPVVVSPASTHHPTHTGAAPVSDAAD